MKKKSNKTVNDFVKVFSENRGHPLKILLGFYKGEGITMLKSTFLFTLANLPHWLIPIVTANIINIATYPEMFKASEIWWNSIILSVFVIQNIFTVFSFSKSYDALAYKIERTLRICIINKLQHLSMNFHKNTNSGKLQSKIMRDCENVRVLLTSMYRNLYTIVVSVAIAIIVTLKKSPIIILFFLILIPIELFILNILTPRIRKNNTIFRNQVENAQSSVSEMIELIPVTRAHGLQNRETNKLSNCFDNVMSKGITLTKTNSIFSSTSWVVSQLSQIACLAFTGYLAYIGKITVGEVVLYQTYFGQIVGYINLLLNLYPQITSGYESINSIGEILYEESIERNNKILPLPDMQGRVDFRDIYYKYEDGTDWTLNNFNLSVKAGESIALVGGSGSGKSTVLNLLIGFDRPQEGKILIDGINMDNLDLNEYRHQIAVVPQNTVLFAGTIRDNITYGIDGISDEQLWGILREVGLDDIVSELPFGLNTHLGEHGGKMSGGQRQRISIARALLRNPKIIIFDEATSALDSESEKKVQAAVDNMMKKCTTFLVAHRLSTIKNADRIAVVNKGRIVEIGTYDELMEKQGEFYKLKKLQE